MRCNRCYRQGEHRICGPCGYVIRQVLTGKHPRFTRGERNLMRYVVTMHGRGRGSMIGDGRVL